MYQDQITSFEESVKAKDKIISELRDENLNLAQANSNHVVGDLSTQEYIADLKLQLEGKTSNYDSLAADMAQTREKLAESETQHILVKE